MSEDKQKAIFSKNLNSYVTKSGKNQSEIAKNIRVSPQTFNTWCKGIAIPRMSTERRPFKESGIDKPPFFHRHSTFRSNA